MTAGVGHNAALNQVNKKVDAPEIMKVDFYEPNAPQKFTQSLKTTGFGVLTKHPVDWNLVKDVYAEWKDYLNKLEARAAAGDEEGAMLFSPDTQDGFFPMSKAESAKGQTVKDMKHYFHLYFPNGRYPDEVSDKARKLFGQMYELGTTLCTWIWDNMDEHTKERLWAQKGINRETFTLADTTSLTRTLLRVLHYPPYEDGEEEPGAVRAAAHEDINMITILPAGSSRGLEVLLGKTEVSEKIGNENDITPASTAPTETAEALAGGIKEQLKKRQSEMAWYEVPCIEGSIIVNIGDMLQELTGGEYIATTHRVVKPADETVAVDRMSIPCFIHPHADQYLSERYPMADIFLTERLMELGALKKSDILAIKSPEVLNGLRNLGHVLEEEAEASP